MNEMQRSIKSVILAILVLCSTFSFAIEKHYCGGEVVDFSILGKLDQCCDVDNSTSTEFSGTCCANERQLIQASNDQLQVPTLENQSLTIYAIPSVNIFELATVVDQNQQAYLTYFPPKLVTNITIVYETFLI